MNQSRNRPREEDSHLSLLRHTNTVLYSYDFTFVALEFVCACVVCAVIRVMCRCVVVFFLFSSLCSHLFSSRLPSPSFTSLLLPTSSLSHSQPTILLALFPSSLTHTLSLPLPVSPCLPLVCAIFCLHCRRPTRLAIDRPQRTPPVQTTRTDGRQQHMSHHHLCVPLYLTALSIRRESVRVSRNGLRRSCIASSTDSAPPVRYTTHSTSHIAHTTRTQRS